MGLRQHLRQVIDLAPLQTNIPHQEIPYSGVCGDALSGGLLDKHDCPNVLLVLPTCLLLGQKHPRRHLLEYFGDVSERVRHQSHSRSHRDCTPNAHAVGTPDGNIEENGPHSHLRYRRGVSFSSVSV